MPDPSLGPNHRRLLRALMVPRVAVADCTTEQLAQRIGLPARAVRHALAELQRADPQLVCEQVDEQLGLRSWTTTQAAADAMQ